MNINRRSSRKSACRSSPSSTREPAAAECPVVECLAGDSQVLAELQPEAEPRVQPSRKSTKDTGRTVTSKNTETSSTFV